MASSFSRRSSSALVSLVRVLPAGWQLKEYSVRDDHRTMVITALTPNDYGARP